MLRIFRSSKAHFQHDAELADQVYTADALKQLADAGFNAVWVRAVFHQLLKNPRYPVFGQQSAPYLASLNRVIERGAKCGVRLVIFCQEPFGLEVNDPFWTEHPEMAGTDYYHNYSSDANKTFYMRAFCVSSEPVRQYLTESSANLLRALPGLGGVITITASEYISHCYSQYGSGGEVPGQGGTHIGDKKSEPLRCPRCRVRKPTDIVVDILNSMRTGLNEVNPAVPLIAWNWSWTMYEPDPQPSIVSRLQPGIDIQADFERGDVKTDRTGRKIAIDEYSLGFIGPSARFKKIRRAAEARGRRVYAKLQLSATHEIASVTNLPLIGNLYGKARAVRRLNLAGFMGCWNFGNELSLNTLAFNYFLSDACPPGRKRALTALAKQAFPGCRTADVLAAWDKFAEAFDYYPFSIPFLYSCPINYSLALPMRPCPTHAKPITRSWQCDPRDDNDDPTWSFGPFTPEDVAERLGIMSRIWNAGLEAYEAGLASAGGIRDRELSAARAVYCSLRSVANYYRLYLLKRQWTDSLMPQFRAIVKDELAVLDLAIPVYEQDPRQGFHIEGHGYMVTPELMREKRTKLLEYV